MVLNGSQLAFLQSLAEQAMIDECEILRRPSPSGRGPSGGLTADFAVLATVPCRVAPGWQPPFERAFAGGISAQVAAFVYVPLDTDCLPTDRIRLTSGNEAGHTWEVTSTFKERSQDVQLTILCQEVGT